VLAVRFENERLEKLERESASLKAEVSELRQQLSELKKLLE
jgi:prefoldin subunit 5